MTAMGTTASASCRSSEGGCHGPHRLRAVPAVGLCALVLPVSSRILLARRPRAVRIAVAYLPLHAKLVGAISYGGLHSAPSQLRGTASPVLRFCGSDGRGHLWRRDLVGDGVVRLNPRADVEHDE